MVTVQTEPQQTKSQQTKLRLALPSITIFAWISILLISALPTIVWREMTGESPIWLFWAKIFLLIVFIVLSSGWKPIQPLRPFFVIFLLLSLVEALINLVNWQGFINQDSFSGEMLRVQLPRMVVALLMITLLAMKYRRSDFFLVKGELGAPADPIRWLIDKPISWARLGWILALCISLGTLVFLWIAGQPPLEMLRQILPLLPVILFFAACNAFGEEMSYRAAFLAPLYPAVGKQHAMLLTAVWFGLAHFYGVPYGVVGVVMAGILGWFLSKSMLETKGFLWPWFIHFCQDVLIFTFIAIGSVTPGG